ncbi:MAG: hypothetical protein JWM53_6337 [bacterium]|nr:hypothetical protein [bacterium]
MIASYSGLRSPIASNDPGLVVRRANQRLRVEHILADQDLEGVVVEVHEWEHLVAAGVTNLAFYGSRLLP